MSRLLGCNVYVSEGRNAALLQRLEAVCSSQRGVALVNTFVDAPYHRSSYCLASASIDLLTTAAVALARNALAAIDMACHVAAHPRLGAVDHISCHPLGPAASMEAAARLARSIGAQLAQPPTPLPVYLYGAAHPSHATLADTRRRLGYFKPTTSHGVSPDAEPQQQQQQQQQQGTVWCGAGTAADLSQCPPDMGPCTASAASGVLTVGAVPWLVNFNAQLVPGADMAAARRIARLVSERGGGLPGVQAMALQHESCIEVACNLLDPEQSGPAQVEALVAQLAAGEGTRVAGTYCINRPRAEVVRQAEAALASCK